MEIYHFLFFNIILELDFKCKADTAFYFLNKCMFKVVKQRQIIVFNFITLLSYYTKCVGVGKS